MWESFPWSVPMPSKYSDTCNWMLKKWLWQFLELLELQPPQQPSFEHPWLEAPSAFPAALLRWQARDPERSSHIICDLVILLFWSGYSHSVLYSVPALSNFAEKEMDRSLGQKTLQRVGTGISASAWKTHSLPLIKPDCSLSYCLWQIYWTLFNPTHGLISAYLWSNQLAHCRFQQAS